MSKKTERKEKRKSLARQRAEAKSTGFVQTKLRVPKGIEFFPFKQGIYIIDIVPYKAGKGNPHAPKGELYYERTFWSYNKIGPEEKYLVCPSKTFGHKDFIQEVIQEESRKDEPDKKLIAFLKPKERQIFLIWDHDNKDKGVQLLELAFNKLGELLDDRMSSSTEKEGWDLFYFPDTEGMSLRLTIKENKPYGFETKAIDFIKREKSLPKEIVNHGICLDDLLIEPSYNELKSVFLGVDIEDLDNESNQEPVKGTANESVPTKSDPVASDYGISKGDDVEYDGMNYSVIKISPDGTSLTLLDEEDDLIKAISPADVKLITDSPKEEQPEESEVVVEMDDTKNTSREWDEDWDED